MVISGLLLLKPANPVFSWMKFAEVRSNSDDVNMDTGLYISELQILWQIVVNDFQMNTIVINATKHQ